jgi:hypothetical protein
VDLLGSEGKASACRCRVLPRVVVGRFARPTIGMAGPILLNTRNMQVRKDVQAMQALKHPASIRGAMEHHGRQKSSAVLNRVKLLTAKVF